MKDTSSAPLQVAIHGMDGRSHKLMVMFLQGPCKGSAIVAIGDEADVDIIDADVKDAKTILEKRKKLHPDRPLIVLSLQPLSLDNIIFVQKPVQTMRMQEALKQAKQTIIERKKKAELKLRAATMAATSSVQKPEVEEAQMITKTYQPPAVEQKKEPEKKIFVNTDEQKKTSKHKTAMFLDEKSFSSFIGLASGVDYDDPVQLKAASYNARQYYQGYVQSAFKLAISKKRVIQLNSGWKPLVIFPTTHEIWVDADDKQLRAFSSVPINNISGSGAQGVTVSAFDLKKNPAPKDLTKFQSMDAFVWKLAIWTSKGRYPQSIDIDRPVYLKRWPNFTRLTISPHSLRIVALLMEGPRTLTNIAQVLNIKQHYVFAFFSAAYATGLAGQANRKADQMLAPTEPKATKKKGLLNNIMRKLRGK